MTTIQIDDRIAEGLTAIARAQGVSVQAFLASLVEQPQHIPVPERATDFETELNQLLFHGPSLPADFSRADIYADHD